MFKGCTSIKLSLEQSDEYPTLYGVPMLLDAGFYGLDALTDMFADTGGTFTGTPEVDVAMYLHESNSIAE
jgi:hypothetical protein